MGATIGDSCNHKKASDWGFVLFMLSLASIILGCMAGVVVALSLSDSTVFGYSAKWVFSPPIVVGGAIFLVFFIRGMIRG